MPSNEIIAHDLTVALVSRTCEDATAKAFVEKYYELYPQVEKLVKAKASDSDKSINIPQRPSFL